MAISRIYIKDTLGKLRISYIMYILTLKSNCSRQHTIKKLAIIATIKTTKTPLTNTFVTFIRNSFQTRLT